MYIRHVKFIYVHNDDDGNRHCSEAGKQIVKVNPGV